MKIGVDIGGSHIAIGVVKDGKIIQKIEKSWTNTDKENIIKSIETFIINHVSELYKKYQIDEVGIGAPGTSQNGIMLSSGRLGIKNYPIIERLQEKIKVPIKIENDAKCAALAEKKYGCLKYYDRSIFLTLGTGIGGAAFLDGKLLKAGTRAGYEFGHMVIERDGIPCNCGRKGCFETYASMKVFKTNLINTLNLDKTTKGQELLHILRESKKENNNYELIENIIEEYIENLNIGILNLIAIFEPQVIGIGGSFVYFQEILLEKLKEKIKKANKEKAERENIIIETAILGNDAGIIGATL